MKIVNGACPHDCPDTCAWHVTVDDSGRAVKLAGDPEHPFTRGALCSKLKRYPERVYSDQRILHPLRRTGAKAAEIPPEIMWGSARSHSPVASEYFISAGHPHHVEDDGDALAPNDLRSLCDQIRTR